MTGPDVPSGDGEGDADATRAGTDAPSSPFDAGLAAERTELAWERSALSLVVCGLAVARGVPWVSGGNRRQWEGIAVLLLGVVVWAVSAAGERRRRAAPGRARRPAQRADLVGVAYGTSFVAAAALAIAVLHR